MPTIAWFYGIAIRMYFNDHAPPHFHALYGGNEALVLISTGEVIRGNLPISARKMVKRWTLLHRAELEANWQRSSINEPFERIAGLDAD